MSLFFQWIKTDCIKTWDFCGLFAPDTIIPR